MGESDLDWLCQAHREVCGSSAWLGLLRRRRQSNQVVGFLAAGFKLRSDDSPNCDVGGNIKGLIWYQGESDAMTPERKTSTKQRS